MVTRKLSILFGLAIGASCIGGPASEEEAASVGSAPLRYRSYDVLFTNPMCGPYDLEEEVGTVGGGTRTTTHENAYCFPQRDSGPSGARPASPLHRLKSWIEATGEGDEIFAAYFSFSNKSVKNALCQAAQRNVKVTFVKDSGQDGSAAAEVAQCSPSNVTILERGNTGDVGYHHNKFLMVNPTQAGPNDTADEDGTTYVKLVYSSGNMSSGTVLHQENWHFLEVARSSYFTQSHVCVANALRDEGTQAYRSRKAFTEYLDNCRASVQAQPESDIGAFFLPDRGDSQELRRRFEAALETASSVDVAAHRFSLFYLQAGLRNRLTSDDDFSARLVADDDLYWLYPREGEKQDLGDNMPFENTNVWKLRTAANDDTSRFEARFIETNSDMHLLHHNKFVIARGRADGQPDTVVCGAANFTNDAFWYGSDSTKNNFENIYVVQIPHVVQAMERQFDGFWGETEYAPEESHPPVATPVDEMPVEYTRAVSPQ
ncbi:MAG: hypothetical protein HYY06_19820 [Deltaproteobacteria bacterium]|nr:hypothetical protein [Deltaproteobacteria bacterium]